MKRNVFQCWSSTVAGIVLAAMVAAEQQTHIELPPPVRFAMVLGIAALGSLSSFRVR